VLDFADISGPGAADVDTEVQYAGQAYTMVKGSRLPLAVQIRSQNGIITAVNVDGTWQDVGTLSNTTSLALGSVFLVIGVLIFGWPWIRRMGKSPTALIRGRP
jgi:hypothetical protein